MPYILHPLRRKYYCIWSTVKDSAVGLLNSRPKHFVNNRIQGSNLWSCIIRQVFICYGGFHIFHFLQILQCWLENQGCSGRFQTRSQVLLSTCPSGPWRKTGRGRMYMTSWIWIRSPMLMKPRLAFLKSNASTCAVWSRGWGVLCECLLVHQWLIVKFSVRQKVIVIDKAAESLCPISSYPLEHCSTHSNSQSHETRMFPYINQPNQSITVAVSPPVVCSHISPISISPQQFGRAPVLPSVSVLPSTGSVIGYTDLR